MGEDMEHSTLSSLIESLERGTKLHICVAFLDNCGNRKTRCTRSQSVHNMPVCMAVKGQPGGLVSCYRCRNTVQKAVIQRRKPMAGLCTNGVYEYCRPVIYDGRVICVIFVGNILTGDPRQREKLSVLVGKEMLETMEQGFTQEDCVKTADILESYILFLFDRYGIEKKNYDPLVENIKSYVRENMAYDFSMEEMASVFNYTPKYLGRVFRLRTGQTIKDYCNRAKVAQAKFLLTETDIGIEKIGVQVGYNSVNYFDRIFRKITGLSPQAYRSSAKKQERSAAVDSHSRKR